jgi:hypothetical protein
MRRGVRPLAYSIENEDEGGSYPFLSYEKVFPGEKMEAEL